METEKKEKRASSEIYHQQQNNQTEHIIARKYWGGGGGGKKEVHVREKLAKHFNLVCKKLSYRLIVSWNNQWRNIRYRQCRCT